MEMQLIDKGLLKRFDDFMRNLKSDDVIALYHDADPDGTCSAVIMAKAIERLVKKKIDFHVGRQKGEHYLSSEMADFFISKKVTKLITLDIAADEKPEGLLKAQKSANVLVIDHHKLYSNLNENSKVLLVKPQLLYHPVDPQQYCTSKFVYDLASRHADVSDCDWIASVGVIADVASKMWVDFLTSVFKKYKIKLAQDFFKSRLGKVAHTISSAEVYDEKNVDLCFDVLYKSSQPKDVLKSEVCRFATFIDDEIQKLVRNAKSNAEWHFNGELMLYEIAPKYAVTSPLSTIIGFKYPSTTVVIISEDDGRMHVSARRQDKKIAVNELLERAIIGFENATAGGHVAAAGASFYARDKQEFKRRIVELVNNLSSSV